MSRDSCERCRELTHPLGHRCDEASHGLHMSRVLCAASGFLGAVSALPFVDNRPASPICRCGLYSPALVMGWEDDTQTGKTRMGPVGYLACSARGGRSERLFPPTSLGDRCCNFRERLWGGLQ